MGTVLLTGATGFVGKSIAETLRRTSGSHLRFLKRANPSDPSNGTYLGDLTDRASLAQAFDGVDTVIHAASYTGGDPVLQRLVNVDGTVNLVEEASAAGVARIIYLSTTSVYGTGPHRGAVEQALQPNPASSLSTTRLEAENVVLAAGGHIVRATLTFGDGDMRFLPGVLKIRRLLDGFTDGGRAKISVIRVDHLGKLIASLASSVIPLTAGQVLIASHASPSSIREIGGIIENIIGRNLPNYNRTWSEALEMTTASGISEHQLALASVDHWYDSRRIWNLTGLDSPAAFELRRKDVAWYRSQLA